MSVIEFVGFVLVSLLVAILAGCVAYACQHYQNGLFAAGFFYLLSLGGVATAGHAMLNISDMLNGE